MKITVVVLVVVGSIAGLMALLDSATPAWLGELLSLEQEEPVPVFRAEPREVRLVVNADGRLIGLKTVQIEVPKVRTGSLKVAWLLDEGTYVQPGTVVIRFDESDARISLEQSENRYLRYGLQINERQDSGSGTIESLSRDLETAELELDYAETQVLEDQGIFSLWDIKESVVSAGLARFKKEAVDRKKGLQRSSSDASVDILEIDRRESRETMDTAHETLSNLELRAPEEGILLFRRRKFDTVEVGAEVWSGERLVEIANVKEFRGVIHVPERGIYGIRTGRTVEIRLEIFPGILLHGRVSRVSRVARQIDRRDPRQYFVVDLAVEIPLEMVDQMRPGLALSAAVQIGNWESALSVPQSAVIERESSQFVYLQTEDGFEETEVEILGSEHGFHVVQGIPPGALVCLRNPYEQSSLTLPDFNAPAARTTRGRRFVFE